MLAILRSVWGVLVLIAERIPALWRLIANFFASEAVRKVLSNKWTWLLSAVGLGYITRATGVSDQVIGWAVNHILSFTGVWDKYPDLSSYWSNFIDILGWLNVALPIQESITVAQCYVSLWIGIAGWKLTKWSLGMTATTVGKGSAW